MKATALPPRLFLLLVMVALMAGGCITPLTWEQQSDWRWKQYNPEYRAPYPTDPGWTAP